MAPLHYPLPRGRMPLVHIRMAGGKIILAKLTFKIKTSDYQGGGIWRGNWEGG